MTAHVITAVEDRVARIELARPEKKNALTADMYRAMTRALAAADADPSARAVLLHGAPGCFCAGNDLNDFLSRPAGGESPPQEFLSRLSTLAKPIVAAVAGPAVGIGTTMLLHCESRLRRAERDGSSCRSCRSASSPRRPRACSCR